MILLSSPYKKIFEEFCKKTGSPIFPPNSPCGRVGLSNLFLQIRLVVGLATPSFSSIFFYASRFHLAPSRLHGENTKDLDFPENPKIMCSCFLFFQVFQDENPPGTSPRPGPIIWYHYQPEKPKSEHVRFAFS